MSEATRKQLQNFYILAIQYGQYQTMSRWECVDKEKSKIPWYTYPAIEYLNNIDFTDKIVFEYGSGNSSFYWAGKAKFVYSVEHNKEWYLKIKDQISSNQMIELCESCLLYTSPSPRDQRGSRMPSSA